MEDARNQIFSHLRQRIVNAIARRFGRERAEDMAQNVMVVLLRKYPHVSDEVELGRLAMSIKGFVGFEELVELGRAVQQPEEGWDRLTDRSASPENTARRKQLENCLYACIPKLSERCKEIIRRRLLEWDSMEIAKLFKISGDTLNVAEWRCRRRLREIMAADCGIRGIHDV